MFLTNRAMNSFLKASILTMCVSSLNTIVDGIIVGQFVAPEALAAIGLYAPFVQIQSAFLMLFLFSATSRIVYYIGERDYKTAGSFMSVSATMLIIVGMVLSIFAVFCTDCYVKQVCYDDTVKPYLHIYFQIVGGGTILFFLSQMFSETVNIDGRPLLSAVVAVISVVCNIGMDYLFVAVLGWGIAGSAAATVISCAVVILLLGYNYVFTGKCSFNIHLFRYFSMSVLKQILKPGAGMAVTAVFSTIYIYIFNYSTQQCCGTKGLFALSVGMILYNTCTGIAIGIGRSVAGVGGFLKGQHDWDGFCHVINRSLVITFICGVGVVLGVICSGNLLATIFGASTMELKCYTSQALRIFIWMIPFSMLITLLMFIYQTGMKIILIPIPIAVLSVVGVIVLLSWPHIMSPHTFWYAFPVLAVLALFVIYIISECVRGGNSMLYPFTHAPRQHNSEKESLLQLSVLTDKQDLIQTLYALRNFLNEQHVNADVQNRIMLCVEETLLNINEYAGIKGNHHYYDVVMRVNGYGTQVVIKDDGYAFNPLIVKEENRGLGLKILMGVCKCVDYQYMYGQNMVFLQFSNE